ncbi:MAG TPA: protein phosphatase 2C domain-containing protein [Parafilimonas sp.]|nr:protein phosphatase 2C domain-containing protein [Parafilimonas sp.]
MAENFYGSTDTGKMRDNNEDNFIAQHVVRGKYIAGCVIDGVGGYEGGEIAAAIARTAILNAIKKTSNDIIDTLKKALGEANEKIFDKKRTSGEHPQMACVLTIALADINENKFYYAHVGDTRLYLFRDHSLVKVTHDHSFVGFLEDSGRLSEEAAMKHPKRNEINKALGFHEGKFLEPDYVETGESPFLPGDMLLLCSDGLSDMLDSKKIIGIISSNGSVKEKCRELINAANLAGGKDNITVVLIQNDKPPVQQEATKPLSIKKNEIPGIVAQPKKIIHENNVHREKGSGAKSIRLLAALCLLSLAILAWFVFNGDRSDKDKKELIRNAGAIIRNAQVKRLSDSISNNAIKKISLASIFGNARSVPVNDSMIIKQDSLHIIGNGITLMRDSVYNGAAFIFFPECKYVLLDSITFENFNTAIVVRNAAIHLKNVRFKNCTIPVAYAMKLPGDSSLSGVISNSTLLKIDSAKTIIKTK